MAHRTAISRQRYDQATTGTSCPLHVDRVANKTLELHASTYRAQFLDRLDMYVMIELTMTAHGFFTVLCALQLQQLSLEKVRLAAERAENAFEAEQEYIMHKLRKQVCHLSTCRGVKS